MRIKFRKERGCLSLEEKARYAKAIGVVIRQLKEFHAKIKEDGIEISYSVMIRQKGAATWIDY